MSFSRITADTYGNPDAELAVNTANARILEVVNEARQIEEEAAAIVATALNADPKDAPKLCKRHEALRARKLRALMYELRIPGLKREAETAVRVAARAHAEKQAELLATCEGDLRKAALSLGYVEGDRNFTQLFVSDPNRRGCLGSKTDAEFRANNYHALTAEDRIHEAELRKRIAEALR
jgi:hypothetical protein